jgi:hypothetical protein
MTDFPVSKVHKTLRATVADAVARGWVLERTTRHLRLIKPGCGIVIFPKTPGEYRAMQNLKGDLRRAERQL